MIVRDLHVIRAILAPPKTHAPLIIDADTVLPLAFSIQRLEPIAREPGQGLERVGSIQDAQTFFRLACEGSPLADDMSLKEPLGITVLKASDHAFL